MDETQAPDPQGPLEDAPPEPAPEPAEEGEGHERIDLDDAVEHARHAQRDEEDADTTDDGGTEAQDDGAQ